MKRTREISDYNMQKGNKRYKLHKGFMLVLMLACTFLMSACGNASRNTTSQNDLIDITSTQTGIKKADSLDEAVIVKMKESKQEITLYNTQLGQQYTLKYDGVTSAKNKYDEELVMSQLQTGEVVIVSFLKEEKLLRTIQQKKDCFVEQSISEYKLNKASKALTIGDKQYKLSDHTFVYANGKVGELMDIHNEDVLRISGTDHVINSIVVEKGHGYLKLVNDEYFIGGWIEVSTNLIKPITENMLLLVPEGEYEVLISNKGYGGTKTITIEANKETLLDIGDLKGDEVLMGSIIFTVNPTSATLSIDGKEIDYSRAVSLEYGIHQITLKADGYKTMKKYIKVGSGGSSINIEMEPGSDSVSENSTENSDGDGSSKSNGTKENSSNSSSSNADEPNTGTSTDGSSVSTSVSTSGRVYIDAPEGAQLYVDGNYVGVVPTSFQKVSGDHVLSFRKDNCETRSYTLSFDTSDQSVTFSFSDLTIVGE